MTSLGSKRGWRKFLVIFVIVQYLFYSYTWVYRCQLVNMYKHHLWQILFKVLKNIRHKVIGWLYHAGGVSSWSTMWWRTSIYWNIIIAKVRVCRLKEAIETSGAIWVQMSLCTLDMFTEKEKTTQKSSTNPPSKIMQSWREYQQAPSN